MSKSKSNTIQRVLATALLLLAPLFLFKEYRSLISRKGFISSVHNDIVLHEQKNNAQKSFIVFIVSGDDSPFIERSLESVINQKYSFFKIAFIDTSSNLVNTQRAKKIARRLGLENEIAFYRARDTREFKDTYYQALKNYRDDEIVVHLQASDWFVNTHVLEKLNEIYKDPDVWLTYSEYLEVDEDQLSKRINLLSKVKKNMSGVQAPWLISHLKTYYVGLVKQVDLESMPNPRQNHDAEKIIMKALMRLSKWHIRFIPEVLYVHNDETQNTEPRFWRVTDFLFEHFSGGNSPIKPYFAPPKRIKP